MVEYKSRVELQDYMIQAGDNFILSHIHNRPHEALSDNSDILYSRLQTLAGKLGLSTIQKKLDGFPIYYDTYFVKTGMTMADALSRLDFEIRDLENLYRVILYGIALRGSIEWIVKTSQLPVSVINTGSVPEPLNIIDFGSFLVTTYGGGSYSTGYIALTDNVESPWKLYSKTIEQIFGKAFALEKSGPSLIGFMWNNQVDQCRLYSIAYNETGSEGYKYYVKFTPGEITYSSSSLYFQSEADDVEPSINLYLSDRPVSFQPYRVGYKSYTYLEYGEIEGARYILPRDSRLFTFGGTGKNRTELYYHDLTKNVTALTQQSMSNAYIEGIDGTAQVAFHSHKEIRSIEGGKLGMALADQYGNIIFRINNDLESIPGTQWDSVAGSSDYGVIARAESGYNFDYPTFLPVASGYICFFNGDYTNGVEDTIYLAISRDGGLTWEVPDDQPDITGIFPKLFQSRNGSIYLYFWTATGIKMLKIYISTERTVIAGGS